MDSHNPYSPPAAAVKDADELRVKPRPRAVYAAIVMVVSSVIVAIANRSGTSARPRMPEAEFLAAAWQLCILIFTLWIGYQLGRGRNWARYVLLAYTAIGIMNIVNAWYAIPAGVTSEPDVTGTVLYLLPAVCNVTALVLVFGPGRSWFQGHR